MRGVCVTEQTEEGALCVAKEMGEVLKMQDGGASFFVLIA